MTVHDQTELLSAIDNDRRTHLALFENLKSFVHDSPISGQREQEIVDQYRGFLSQIEYLYLDLITATARWLTTQ